MRERKSKQMAHIDCFFATQSPFTYLMGTRLADIAARHGATVSYKPVDIFALFARTGGVKPADRHPNRQAYRLQDMARQAAKLGMPINMKPAFWPVNMAPSSYAIISAGRAGGGDLAGLIHGFTRAVWAEDRNIADDDVVRDILAANGFEPNIADQGMMQSADAYAQNLEEAVARGVFGAPFFIVGEAVFWGQDRLDDLDLHLAGKI